MRSAYTYTILRYFHDTATGEFLNVGVALYASDSAYAASKCRTTYARVSHVFPGTDGSSFKALMRHIDRQFAEFGQRLREELPFDGQPKSVMEIARAILPEDDSSLQWSPMGSGLTEDPTQELDRLFDRLVARYDEHVQHESRTDDDVWRHYRHNLETRNLLSYLKPKRISVQDDEVEFKHAWKNGVWHCLEPVSFDLVSPDSILDKAHRWLGHITSVKDAAEDFKVYFLLGEPQHRGDNSALGHALNKAVRILEKLPVDREIIRESDVTQFTRHFADEIEQHNRG